MTVGERTLCVAATLLALSLVLAGAAPAHAAVAPAADGDATGTGPVGEAPAPGVNNPAPAPGVNVPLPLPGEDGADGDDGETLVVCPGGEIGRGDGCEYASIQAAVNAASPGDTVRVRPGVYQERVTVNTSNVRIEGVRIEESERVPRDIVFVLDESGSMEGEKLRFTKRAVKQFVDRLATGDRAGVVGYESDARLVQRLTKDLDAVRAGIDELDAGGSTDIADGIRTATDHLDAENVGERKKVEVLVSDGKHNEGPDQEVLDRARAAAENGTVIHAVSIGDDADRDLLRQVANTTGGEYAHAQAAQDLPDIFARIGVVREAVVSGRTIQRRDHTLPHLSRYVDAPATAASGFSVVSDDVEVVNMTVRNFGEHGVAFDAVDGFLAEGLKTFNVGGSGVAVTAATDGVIRDVSAAGSDGSGVRFIAALDCACLVEDSVLKENRDGVALVASSAVTVRDSTVRRNAAGILLLPETAGVAPTDTVRLADNNVTANNDRERFRETHYAGTLHAPVGTGIFLGGTTDVDVAGNTVTDHERAGVALSWFALEPNLNRVRENVLSNPAGVDVFWDGGGAGNCFADNRRPDGGKVTADAGAYWERRGGLPDCEGPPSAGVTDPRQVVDVFEPILLGCEGPADPDCHVHTPADDRLEPATTPRVCYERDDEGSLVRVSAAGVGVGETGDNVVDVGVLAEDSTENDDDDVVDADAASDTDAGSDCDAVDADAASDTDADDDGDTADADATAGSRRVDTGTDSSHDSEAESDDDIVDADAGADDTEADSDEDTVDADYDTDDSAAGSDDDTADADYESDDTEAGSDDDAVDADVASDDTDADSDDDIADLDAPELSLFPGIGIGGVWVGVGLDGADTEANSDDDAIDIDASDDTEARSDVDAIDIDLPEGGLSVRVDDDGDVFLSVDTDTDSEAGDDRDTVDVDAADETGADDDRDAVDVDTLTVDVTVTDTGLSFRIGSEADAENDDDGVDVDLLTDDEADSDDDGVDADVPPEGVSLPLVPDLLG